MRVHPSQGRRRLLQSTQLVQPGVQLAVGVPTTESLVADIQSAMAGAIGSNQLVNAYKAQNGARWGMGMACGVIRLREASGRLRSG